MRTQCKAIVKAVCAILLSLKSGLSRTCPALTKGLLMAFLVSLALLQPAYARTIQVGPDHLYALPSEAARIVHDGDIVEIAPGDYTADATLWRATI